MATATRRAGLAVATVAALGAAASGAARPAAAQGRVASVGAPVSAALAAGDPTYRPRGQFHAYALETTAGQRYQVTLRSPDFDAYVWIARMVGELTEEVVNDDDSAGNTDARLRFRAAPNTAYLIVVQTLEAGKVGRYDLQVETLAELPAARPIAMQVGQALEGTLDDSSPLLEADGQDYRHQVYTFRARGQRLRVTMRSGAFDAFLRITRVTPSGEEEVATDDDSGGGSDAQVLLNADGEYRVYARPLEADRGGAYTVALSEVVARPVTSRPLAVGQTVDGRLVADDAETEDGRRFQQYTVTGRPGERFTVTLRSSDFDAMLEWGSLNGALYERSESDDDSGGGTDAQLSLTMPASGTWVLRVFPLERGKLGAYRLVVERRAGK